MVNPQYLIACLFIVIFTLLALRHGCALIADRRRFPLFKLNNVNGNVDL